MKKEINQYDMASKLIAEINLNIEDLEELTPDFLLDMMGVLSFSFTEGDDASIAFVFGCVSDES